MIPSNEESRILTTFGWRHSVKMFISVNKHSRHSFLFIISFVRIIFTATCLRVSMLIASFTLLKKEKEISKIESKWFFDQQS